MALSRPWLDRVPSLDPAFGRGYGEEVDWCQKVRRLGGRHVGTAGLFVEHRGGGSFGSEAKLALVAANNAIVARRYPSYDAEVQAFIAADPLRTPRLHLAAAWAAAGGAEVPVYLAHSMGGGAEADLARRLADDLSGGGAAVVVRVGGAARWRVEIHAPEGMAAGVTEDAGLVRRLLAPLRRRRVVYSCAVGDLDPVEVPALLLGLADDAESARLEVLLHDFFPVSPSYTLLDASGTFRGPVAPGLPGSGDRAHATTRADGGRVDLAAWQAAWRPLVERAEVVAFSASSRDLVLAAHPGARVRVAPHEMLHPVPVLPRPAGPRVLGVLGAIGLQKGVEVLQGLAPLVGAPGAPVARLVVIGLVDPAYPLPASVAVSGAYRLSDLPALAARHRITDWLIPSIWPETFSFATREALSTGLPVHAFDLGAQGEAVRAAPNGRALDPSLRGAALLAALA